MSTTACYTLASGCTLRSLGGQYLLLVYPSTKEPYALEVNESFAHLVSVARRLGTFSETDLISALQQDYGLSPERAKEETGRIIALWKEYGLL